MRMPVGAGAPIFCGLRRSCCVYTELNFPSREHTVTHLRTLRPHRFASAFCTLTLALWLCGCAGVSVRGAWQNGASHDLTFSKVLVVGVSPDYNLRCDFEYAFASQLASPATTVFSSCDSMGPKEQLTRENIERVIAKVQADGVLVTRLVSASAGEQQGGTWDTQGSSQYKATDFGYGAYGMPVTYVEFQTAPPLTNLTSSVHVVTKLYETRNATVIYILDTQTKSQEIDSTQATLMTITAPTAERLRRVGLIR
jgi:hypothetical protein